MVIDSLQSYLTGIDSEALQFWSSQASLLDLQIPFSFGEETSHLVSRYPGMVMHLAIKRTV